MPTFCKAGRHTGKHCCGDSRTGPAADIILSSLPGRSRVVQRPSPLSIGGTILAHQREFSVPAIGPGGISAMPHRWWKIVFALGIVIRSLGLVSEKTFGQSENRPGHSGSDASFGCGTKQLVKVTLNVPYRTPLLSVRANGNPLVLLLDTGAERTLLTSLAAERIGAEPPRAEIPRTMRGVAGKFSSREVELRNFSIEGVEIEWHRVQVAPLLSSRVPTDGLVGTDVLEKFDLDIDL